MSIQQPTSNPFLKQIYDTMLDKAIVDVQVAYSSNNPELFWANLQKLRIMVREKEQRGKLDKFVKETEKDVDRMKSQRGFTVADTYTHMLEAQRFLMNKALELFDLTLGVLDELGYLKKNSKSIQSNMPGSNQLFDTKQ